MENVKRTLKVPEAIMEKLKERGNQKRKEAFLYGEGYRNRGLICCQKNGDYRSLASFNAGVKRVCQKARIPLLTTQDLRDMYAEMMLKTEEISFLKLTALMGYGSVEETYERYSDLLVDVTQHCRYIDQILGNKGTL